MKKIDVHVHLIENIHGIGANGVLRDLGDGTGIYENGKIARIIPEYLNKSKITPDDLLETMDKNDVEFCVALQGHYAGIQNLYTAEAMKKYPDRIIGGCMYDPYYRKLDGIRNYLYDELGFYVTKFELSNTSGLMCNHDCFDIAGELFDGCVDYCGNKRQIVVVDIGRPGNDCYQVDRLRELIIKHPNINFVVCHLTAPQENMLDLLRMNMEMLKLVNCYFDIAALPNNVKDSYPFIETQKNIRKAMDIVGSDKIMWGTDYPSALQNYSYADSYRYIEESVLFTNKEKEDILYNNAQYLFAGLLDKNK